LSYLSPCLFFFTPWWCVALFPVNCPSFPSNLADSDRRARCIATEGAFVLVNVPPYPSFVPPSDEGLGSASPPGGVLFFVLFTSPLTVTVPQGADTPQRLSLFYLLAWKLWFPSICSRPWAFLPNSPFFPDLVHKRSLPLEKPAGPSVLRRPFVCDCVSAPCPCAVRLFLNVKWRTS